jgi:hypothetical protein
MLPLSPQVSIAHRLNWGGILSYVRRRGAVTAPLLFSKIGIEPLNCYIGMAVLLFHFGGRAQDVWRYALILSNYFLTALTLNSYQLRLRLCDGTTASIMRLHRKKGIEVQR